MKFDWNCNKYHMNHDNKNLISNIVKIIILVITISLRIFTITTFSLMVQQDQIGIYCIKDNGVRAVNEWVEIDFEGDYYLEYYYFDSSGYLIMNGITPDGYIVNERGQRIDNGIIQRKHYQIPTSKETTNNSNNRIIKSYNDNFSNIFVIVFIIGLLLIVLFVKFITRDGDSKKHKSKEYDDYDTSYQPKHTKKRTSSNDTTVSRSVLWYLRSDTDKKGEEGEDEAAEELKDLGKDFIVLRNINLPRTNKEPVQIDFLCISNKGIFVIEVKNWLGMITGSYEDEIWHSQIYDIVNEQTNPVKQNEWHIDVLKRYLNSNMTCYSIIVFTDRADIDCLDKKQHRSYITNIDNLNDEIYSIYKHSNVRPYDNYKGIAGYFRKFAIRLSDGNNIE